MDIYYVYNISCLFSGLSRVTVSKLFPTLLDCLGFYGLFYLFSSIAGLLLIYGHFIIPENKGQSLVVTEDKLLSNKVDDNKD